MNEAISLILSKDDETYRRESAIVNNSPCNKAKTVVLESTNRLSSAKSNKRQEKEELSWLQM